MKITGSESLNDLKKYCCSSDTDDTQDFLIIDDKCVRSLLEECKRICLQDFAVPVDEITEMSRNLESGQALLLEDFRVAVVYIINNESMLYRYMDGYTTDKETMRYEFDASITIDDINFGESVPAKLTFSLNTNSSPIIITWNNISDMVVGDEYYDIWKKAIDTWKNMSPERVTNTLTLPNFSTDFDINMFLSETENKLSNTIMFQIGNDDIIFDITAYVEYDIDNDTSIFDIKNVVLGGKFIDPNIIHVHDDATHTTESSKIVINNVGSFVTLNAKNFSSVKSLLILSSKTIMKKLELYNDSNTIRKIRILLAK